MILDAAKVVFAQSGFYNSKVSEIAREAHVADGTIYLYFKNKDDILISLFEEELKRIIGLVKEAINDIDDPSEKLRVFCRTHMTIIESDRCLAEVIQVELRQSNKFMREYKNRCFLSYLNTISEIIFQGQEQGIFRLDLKPDIAARVIFGSLDELSNYLVTGRRKRFDVQDVSGVVADFFLKGIVVDADGA